MSARPLASLSPFILLAAVLAYLAIDSRERIRLLSATTDVANTVVRGPAEDAYSATGYEHGMRKIILPRFAIDGYHWLMQTQQMFAEGELRVRHVDYDNAPEGRAVHWASPWRWWLGLLAWIDHQITGAPIGRCVERSALYAGPLALGCMPILLTAFLRRRLGANFTTWIVLGPVVSLALHDYFVSGNPDHHGAAALCAFLCVLGLIAGGAGWAGGKNGVGGIQPMDTRVGRRWFALSAIAGAFGLWISAASQVPVLCAVGLAAFLAGPRAKSTAVGAQPELWQFWGRIGAAASLAMWLIEYFPHHLGWRLEVLHPLYALAWWGGGELVSLRWRQPSLSAFFSSLRQPIALAALAAVAALPLTLLIGGTSVFVLNDKFLWKLHHDYIQEFQSLRRFISLRGADAYVCAAVLPWLGIIPAVVACAKKRADAPTRSVLLIALVPALLFTAMAWLQIRWIGFSHALLIVVLATFHRVVLPSASPLRRRLFIGAFVALLAFPLNRVIHLTRTPTGIASDNIVQVATREIAHWLNRRMGAERPVVAASPGISTALAFHGNARTLGTMYWENLDGLATSARFFGARNDEEARRIVEAAGITHVVMVSWNDFSEPYTKLIRELDPSDPLPQDAFIPKLIDTKIAPPWLRPVPFLLPENSALANASVFLFEVVPPQTRAESLVQLVHFLLETHQDAQAARFLTALQALPESAPAWLVRARLHLVREERAAFVTAMNTLFGLLNAGATLNFEEHVQFALLLAVAGLDDQARREFAYCWETIARDRGHLLRLPPSAIVYLFQQGRRLGIPISDDLADLGYSLLPPSWVEQLRK